MTQNRRSIFYKQSKFSAGDLRVVVPHMINGGPNLNTILGWSQDEVFMMLEDDDGTQTKLNVLSPKGPASIFYEFFVRSTRPL